MAETTHRVACQLTYRLQDGVLFGLASGRQIHSLTSRPGGTVIRIVRGRYELTPPRQHPVFGLIAFACPSDPSRPGDAIGAPEYTRPGGTKSWDMRPGGVNAWDMRPGGTSAWDMRPGGTNFAVDAFNPRRGGTNAAPGFVLAKSPLGENSLIVINGFEELMESLALSCGSSIDVVT